MAYVPMCYHVRTQTLAMASNRPGFDDTTLGQGLRLANYVFIGLFAAEAAIKIVALGFVLAPGTYLRNGERAAAAL